MIFLFITDFPENRFLDDKKIQKNYLLIQDAPFRSFRVPSLDYYGYSCLLLTIIGMNRDGIFHRMIQIVIDGHQSGRQ